MNSTIDELWSDLAFKKYIFKTSVNLGKYFLSDYKTAIHIIDKVIMNYNVCLDGYVFFALVEINGQNEEDCDILMAALAGYTPYVYSQIHLFINAQEHMMIQMKISVLND